MCNVSIVWDMRMLNVCARNARVPDVSVCACLFGDIRVQDLSVEHHRDVSLKNTRVRDLCPHAVCVSNVIVKNL